MNHTSVIIRLVLYSVFSISPEHHIQHQSNFRNVKATKKWQKKWEKLYKMFFFSLSLSFLNPRFCQVSKKCFPDLSRYWLLFNLWSIHAIGQIKLFDCTESKINKCFLRTQIRINLFDNTLIDFPTHNGQITKLYNALSKSFLGRLVKKRSTISIKPM